MKTPVVLHIEIGADFLKTMLDRFGTDGWNRWLNAIIDRLPLSWSEGEDEPPARLWFDIGSADFTGMKLDGADLGLVDCEGAQFDGASLKGAMLTSCPHASFRYADLSDATFVYGDVSGVDFTDARITGVAFVEMSYDSECPPVGLPDALLRSCSVEPIGNEPEEWATLAVGLVQYPVTIEASLAEAAHL